MPHADQSPCPKPAVLALRVHIEDLAPNCSACRAHTDRRPYPKPAVRAREARGGAATFYTMGCVHGIGSE